MIASDDGEDCYPLKVTGQTAVQLGVTGGPPIQQVQKSFVVTFLLPSDSERGDQQLKVDQSRKVIMYAAMEQLVLVYKSPFIIG